MLTANDLTQIEVIVQRVVQKNIKDGFQDFYEHIFEPFATGTEERFEQNLQQHKEIVIEVKALKHEVGEIKEYVKDHDKRINNLESSVVTKN